jgi:DnaK suppressor protein
VIGRPPPEIALPAVETDAARQLLRRERERVEQELASLRSDREDGELSSVDQHTADAGTELFENERDRSMVDRLEGELEAIERAERRLEEGTYGVSVDSGEPIPDARLEAVPWAERTAQEQSRYER